MAALELLPSGILFLVKILLAVVLILAIAFGFFFTPMGLSGMGWCPACIPDHLAFCSALCLGIVIPAAFILLAARVTQRMNFAFQFLGRVNLSILLRPPRWAPSV